MSSADGGVRAALLPPLPPTRVSPPTGEHDCSVQLIFDPSHVQPQRPRSKSTSLITVTRCYLWQPAKRLWRSNQLWLNTKCDGPPTTVNPALPKRWWRLIALILLVYAVEAACAHLPCICLGRQEVDCPPLVYWYCLSFMMTGTIFLKKMPHRRCFSIFLFRPACFSPPPCYFCIYIACAYTARTLSNVCFSWGCMKNQSRVVGLHLFSPACIIVFLYLVKHITVWGLFPLKMEIQFNIRAHKYRKEAFFYCDFVSRHNHNGFEMKQSQDDWSVDVWL